VSLSQSSESTVNQRLNEEASEAAVANVIGIPVKSTSPHSKGRSQTAGDESRDANYVNSQRSQSGLNVSVFINDTDDLNDERIKPHQLRKLLQSRPDLSALLYECVVEEGLDNMDDEDDNS
jgi:hypothetical protein